MRDMSIEFGDLRLQSNALAKRAKAANRVLDEVAERGLMVLARARDVCAMLHDLNRE
jgi:hypothetical protein